MKHFIRKFPRLSRKDIQGLSPGLMSVLMAHDFPGNIRELENIIEYATVDCKNGLLSIEHFPDHLKRSKNAAAQPPRAKQSRASRIRRF